MKISMVLCFVVALNGVASAQLYMPRNVHDAIRSGTRTMTGRPGSGYWQNSATYDITVAANPPDRVIRGTEEITYVNNSPNTLKVLYFKLIMNIHTPGAVRMVPFSADYLTMGTQIDSYTENGVLKKWTPTTGTVKGIELTTPLAPKASVKLSIIWHYDISVESNREGELDSTTYFLAYFYPRVAVYDDYNGWDRISFTDDKEFYNDFNNYTFHVIVPKNFVVWATGDLQNALQVLQPAFQQKLNDSYSSDKVINIATPAELAAGTVTAQQPTNTWSWQADNVSDVAICLSDHYVWDASSVVVDPSTRRRTSVQSAYLDADKNFHQMVEYGRHSLDWFSNHWPGIPYPYSKTTIVQGFGDMEYPMMVNDSPQEDPVFARFVAEHEIAHTWFPFYMGINETRYGFMDEGWTTAFEYLIGIDDLGKEKATEAFKSFRVTDWIKSPAAEEDIAIITPSSSMIGIGMGDNEYGKPAIGYLALKDLLGDALFKKCLHEFMARWHGKHPNPWDLFYTFNDVSQMDLNWFWASWFFSNNYIDLALTGVSSSGKTTKVTIDNIGGYPAPVDIIATYEDGTKETFHQTPAIWKANLKQAIVKVATSKKVKGVVLEGGIFVDADLKNNTK